MADPSAQYHRSLERVLARLEERTGRSARPEGGQWKALCPAHDDRTPSLTVKWDNGKTVLYCHAGCTQRSGTRNDPKPVLDALGLQVEDLFDEERDCSGRRATVTHINRAKRAATQPQRYEVPADRQPRTVAQQDKGEATGAPEITCWHFYQDLETEEVTWACLRIVTPTEHGYDKQFRYAHRDDDKRNSYLKVHNPISDKDIRLSLPDGWAAGAPKNKAHRALYRLSAVRTAVAEGRTVYVVEGESDADAATFAGVTATTNPMGAGAWLEQYGKELVGADVVIVADCDASGIQRAETVTRSLMGTAASIRVVQAHDGKDVRDHLDAGYAIADLVEVDLGIRFTPEAATTSGGGGDTGSSPDNSEEPRYIDDPAAPNERPEYVVRNGELVERTWRQERRGENPIWRARYKTVLGCVAWVTEVTAEDHGEEEARYYRPTRDVTVHLERRDDNGQPTDEVDVRMPIEALRKGDWIDEWPWPDTIISRRRSDKEKTHSALYQAIPAPRNRTPVYLTTGWRHHDTGSIFVHGGGAIGRGGSLDVDFDLDPVLARTAMPDPTDDPAILRAAYWEASDPLRELPAHIVAPLRGLAFRGLMGTMQMVTNVAGVKNTAKTSVCRLVLQHMVPQMRFSRGVKEMISGASHLSSSKGMARMLSRAKDIPLLIDDLAPDRGGAAEARVRLGELARQIYNGSIQVKAHYEGGRVVTEQAPRCALLTTGEVIAEGSGGSRCFNIHVEPGEISVDQIAALETKERCDARGLLGASFLMWAAGRHAEITAWLEKLSSLYLAAWNATLRDVPGDRSRLAEAARDYSLGELLYLTFLHDRGAITGEEADELWQWSVNGIRDAAGASHTDTTDPAANLLSYVRDALWTGRAHLTDRKGGVPELAGDADAPARYGWAPQQRMTLPGEMSTTWHASGTKIGAVVGERVYLIPGETEYVGRSQAQRAERPWTETTVSLSAAMDAHGWLATHTDPRTGREHRSVGRSLYGGITRVWDLPRHLIDGGVDDDPDGSGTGGPRPVDPRLVRRPGWGELPTDHDTTAQQPHDPLPVELPVAAGAEATSTIPTLAPGSARAALQVLPTGNTPAAQPPSPDSEPATTSEEAPTVHPSPQGPAATTRRSRATPVQDITYRTAVLDTHAVYVMEPDGHVTPLPLPEPPSASDIPVWGEALGLRHGKVGLGQIWLTPRLSDHLGLLPAPDADMAQKISQLGLDKSTMDYHARENRALWAMLTDASAQFVADLADDGWWIHPDTGTGEVVIKPFITIEKTMPDPATGENQDRAFEIVLAAYLDRWDAKSGPATIKDHPLPSADHAPEDYAIELTRRVGRLAASLGVPWQQTPAATGAKLIDSLRVQDRDNDWRQLGASPFPELTRLRGQTEMEGNHQWHRVPSHAELQDARALILFDTRAAFLSRAGSMDFGVGEPTNVTGEDAHALLRAKKIPYGTYRVTLPVWDFASLPAPHPQMSTEQTNQRWVMSSSVRLLTRIVHQYTEFDLSDLEIHEAWVWPRQTRLLGEWVNTYIGPALRDARAQAKQARRHAEDATTDVERAYWLQEAASWDAVAAVTKQVYTGYFGRTASPDSARAPQPYQHHHRPHVYEAIKGESRGIDWLKIAQHGAATGIYPIAAAGTDSYYYLAPSTDPTGVQPQADDGRLGKLRVKRIVELTDDARDLLASGISAARLESELQRRHRRQHRETGTHTT